MKIEKKHKVGLWVGIVVGFVIFGFFEQRQDDKDFSKLFEANTIMANKIREQDEIIDLLIKSQRQRDSSIVNLMKHHSDVVFKNNLKYTRGVQDSSWSYIENLKEISKNR